MKWTNIRNNSLLDENEYIPAPKGRQPFIASIFVLAIFLFSFYINIAKCNAIPVPTQMHDIVVISYNEFFLQSLLDKALKYMSDHIFSFMDRHSYYANNIECFKYVVSFGFFLVPLFATLSFALEYDRHMVNAENSLKKKNFTVFLCCIFMAPTVIHVFLFDIEPVAIGYRPYRAFYRDIDLWTSQAFRAIFCTTPVIVLLVDIFAYSGVVFKKTRGQ